MSVYTGWPFGGTRNIYPTSHRVAGFRIAHRPKDSLMLPGYILGFRAPGFGVQGVRLEESHTKAKEGSLDPQRPQA